MPDEETEVVDGAESDDSPETHVDSTGAEAEVTAPETSVTDKPAEHVAPEPSLPDFDAKLDVRIRETETRLRSQFEQMINRVKTSNRDATRARFEELKAYFDQQYLTKAEGLDELVQANQLDPQAAALQKLSWRDRYDKEALKRAQELRQTLADTPNREQQERARFERWFGFTLDEYDLSMSDPEYQSDIAGRPLGDDPDEAQWRARKMMKAAAKKKEARLKGTTSANGGTAPKKPTPVDTETAQRVPPVERTPKPTLDDAGDLAEVLMKTFKRRSPA